MINFDQIFTKFAPFLFLIFLFGSKELIKFALKCILSFLILLVIYDLYLETLNHVYPIPLQMRLMSNNTYFMQNNTY